MAILSAGQISYHQNHPNKNFGKQCRSVLAVVESGRSVPHSRDHCLLLAMLQAKRSTITLT